MFLNLQQTDSINQLKEFYKKKTYKVIVLAVALYAFFLFIPSFVSGQSIKVDLNMTSRHAKEVNEPGYTSWQPDNLKSNQLKIGKAIFTISGDYKSTWWKAGIHIPYQARLVSDGLVSNSSISLCIKGLQPGSHSLLTYHNITDAIDSSNSPKISIYENGKILTNQLTPSVRATHNSKAVMAYFNFKIKRGDSIRFVFKSSYGNSPVPLNGFELDTPDRRNQATNPSPEDGNQHVSTSKNELTISWTNPRTAYEQILYIGTDSIKVAKADKNSDVSSVKLKSTKYTVKNTSSKLIYYWRVDEIDSLNHLTRGNIWKFRPAHLAFPGAEGYGADAIGGRWGRAVFVSNLNDDGPGSLRYAIEKEKGPRVILFNVSGVIQLKSRIAITDKYLTIAGQTAPGKGICITRAPMGMSGANDCIIRDVRVRIGYGKTYDGMGMTGSNHCIIDHCSISWTIDEAFSSRNAQNITLQKTLISEALNEADHQNYPKGTKHGYAGSISGDIGSFHHNLLAHCSGRNWSLAGGLNGDGNYAGRLDIFNNVVYNWYSRVTDGGAHEVNFVNNYYKRGDASRKNITYALKAQYDHFPGTQRYYFSGNVMPGIFSEKNEKKGRIYVGQPQGYSPWVDQPFFRSKAEIQSAETAYKIVLSDVGCNAPALDKHDQRIIQETLKGSYSCKGSRSGLPGLPDRESDVGGLEDYPVLKRSPKWDSDHDGLPNWWESIHGLNPNSKPNSLEDVQSDKDNNGYTEMDEYLNWMACPHYFTELHDTITIRLKDLFAGFNHSPSYKILKTTNLTANIHSKNRLSFIAVNNGLGSVVVEVKDKDGATYKRIINCYVGTIANDESVNMTTETKTNVPYSHPTVKR